MIEIAKKLGVIGGTPGPAVVTVTDISVLVCRDGTVHVLSTKQPGAFSVDTGAKIGHAGRRGGSK